MKKKEQRKNLTLHFLKKEAISTNNEIKYMDYIYYSKKVNNTSFGVKSFGKKL